METALEDAHAALMLDLRRRQGPSDRLYPVSTSGVQWLKDALAALIAEHERLTTPPTDDERGALIAEARERAEYRWPIPPNYLEGDPEHTLLTAQRHAYVLGFEDAAGFRRQGPITGEWVDRVAKAIARAADADYWTTEIAEWEDSEEWEREAHPDNYPSAAYEDREWYHKQARAALEAAREADR